MVHDSSKQGVFFRFLTLGLLPCVVVSSCLWYSLIIFGACNPSPSEKGLRHMQQLFLPSSPNQRMWQTISKRTDITLGTSSNNGEEDDDFRALMDARELREGILSRLNFSLTSQVLTAGARAGAGELRAAIAEDSRRALLAALEEAKWQSNNKELLSFLSSSSSSPSSSSLNNNNGSVLASLLALGSSSSSNGTASSLEEEDGRHGRHSKEQVMEALGKALRESVDSALSGLVGDTVNGAAKELREVLREEMKKRKEEDKTVESREGGEVASRDGTMMSELVASELASQRKASAAVLEEIMTAVRQVKEVVEKGGALAGGGSDHVAQLSQQKAGPGDIGGGQGLAAGRLPEVKIEACGEEGEGERKGNERPWVPRPGKYLLGVCTFSQMSNRMMCIRTYLLTAYLLNRTLIFPTEDLSQRGYDFSIVFDVPRARGCFGNNTVVTLAEYLQPQGSAASLKVDRVLCWQPDCFRPQNKPSHPRIVFPTPEQSTLKTYVHEQDFISVMGGVEADILTFGDIYGAGIFGYPNVKHGGSVPFNACNLLVYPHKAILDTALAFSRTFLGAGFASFHWRRGDFYHYCAGKNFSCYWPLPRVADALLDVLVAHRVRMLYLATNAGQEEVDILTSMLNHNTYNHPVQIVRLPAIVDQPWAQSFLQAKMAGKGAALAMLDKAICAMSRIFISSPSSTFSWDTKALRRGFLKKSCHDHDIGTKTWLPIRSLSSSSSLSSISVVDPPFEHQDEFKEISTGLGI